MKISKFLSLLEPGDIALADGGFTVSEDIALQGARLMARISSPKDVEMSKQLSKHVEQVIGLMKIGTVFS